MQLLDNNRMRHISRMARLMVGTAALFTLLGCSFLGLDATATPGGAATATSANTSTVTGTSTSTSTSTSTAVKATVTVAKATSTVANTATTVPTKAPTSTTAPTTAGPTATTATNPTVQPTVAGQLSITVGAGTQDLQVQADGTVVIPNTVPSAVVTIHFPIVLSGPVQVKVVQPSTITWTVENQTQIDASTVRFTLHAPTNTANGSFTVQVTTPGFTAIHFLVQVGS